MFHTCSILLWVLTVSLSILYVLPDHEFLSDCLSYQNLSMLSTICGFSPVLFKILPHNRAGRATELGFKDVYLYTSNFKMIMNHF